MSAGSRLTWGGFSFDVVRSESMSDSVTTAEHPLEDGTKVTDHTTRQRAVYRATVTQPDQPVDGSAFDPGRGDRLYLSLLQAMAAATLDTLITSVRSFGNMQLVSVGRTRGRPVAAATMDLAWEEREIAPGVEQFVPVESTTPINAASVDVGKVETATPSDATLERSSTLFDLLGGAS